MTQTVTSGRRRASGDGAHHQHPLPHGSAQIPFPGRRSLRVQPPGAGASSAATAASAADPTAGAGSTGGDGAGATRRQARERDKAARGSAVPGAPTAGRALPHGHSERRTAARMVGGRRAASRRAPLTTLRNNSAAAGIMLASAGLLMGAVAPPTTSTDAAPARTAVMAPGSGAASSVTAPAEARVTFGLQSAGPAVELIPPDVARARALSSSLTPAARERKAFSVPVSDPVVASSFGHRVNPLDGYATELHTGIDYAGACGTPVRAADSGTVVESGWHGYGGGKRIVVDHGDGLKTTYNHLSVLEVPAGTSVRRGAHLGAIGSTGNSTGCHLHFEVMVGEDKVDPQPWL